MMRKIILISILFFSATAHAATNTVALSDGQTGRVVQVQTITPPNTTYPNGSASVVIDARDRFGNAIRRTKTVPFRAGAIGGIVRLCVASPVLCAVSSVAVAYLASRGYQIATQNNETTITAPGSTIVAGGQCNSTTLTKPDSGGTNRSGLVGYYPCWYPTSGYTNRRTLRVLSPVSSIPGYTVNLVMSGTAWLVTAAQPNLAQYLPRYDYYVDGTYSTGTDGFTTSSVPATDEQLTTETWAYSNPAQLIQSAPGEWDSSLWEPVDWNETFESATDSATEPVTPTDATPTDSAELLDWLQTPAPEGSVPDVALPSDTIQIPTALDENRFSLPTACPAPAQIQLLGKTVEFSYAPFCSLSDMLRPLLLGLTGLLCFRIVTS